MAVITVVSVQVVLVLVWMARGFIYGVTRSEDNLWCGLFWASMAVESVFWHQQWVAILDAVVAALYLWHSNKTRHRETKPEPQVFTDDV